jgi:beta-lactamase class A
VNAERYRGDGELLDELAAELDDAGLEGSFLVRNLRTGDEIGIEESTIMPMASLVKVPLAAATLDAVRRGRLDGAQRLRIEPGRVQTPGPTGITRFHHHADVALDDAVYVSVALSDGVTTDALFALTPPADVQAALVEWGIEGIAVRTMVGGLIETPAETLHGPDVDLAHTLAIEAGTAGGGHRIAQLDVSLANAASARALIDLLVELWTPTRIDADVAARVRELMANNVHRQRLTPDFATDAARWSSKTGTLLTLRHEMGVVEHADGESFAVVALTRSRVAAVQQPRAEATMAYVARRLRDALRTR